MRRSVLFADGVALMCQIHVVGGACLVGDPTAFVYRDEQMVWVKPGESVAFVEVSEGPVHIMGPNDDYFGRRWLYG